LSSISALNWQKNGRNSLIKLHLQISHQTLNSRNQALYFLVLFIFFIAIFLFSAATGTVAMDFRELIDAIIKPGQQNLAGILVWEIRIPRFLMAFLCGGTLALCGQMLQLLVRNPLADPYTLGTASGAALGVNLALLGFLPPILTSVFILPFWAFAGSFLAGLAVLLFSGSGKGNQDGKLLLAGIAVSILANSVISFLTFFFARGNELRQMVFWAFGSLDKAGWPGLLSISALMLPVLIFTIAGSRTWNLMLLGKEKTMSLGLKPVHISRMVLLSTSFLTACVVSQAGPVGFVGLVVPYCMRQIFPIGQPYYLLNTFFAGAIFLSFCDLLSRMAPFPSGLPVGLITSLVGLPVFLYLLQNSGRRSAF